MDRQRLTHGSSLSFLRRRRITEPFSFSPQAGRGFESALDAENTENSFHRDTKRRASARLMFRGPRLIFANLSDALPRILTWRVAPRLIIHLPQPDTRALTVFLDENYAR
jgi:hypothetical protein